MTQENFKLIKVLKWKDVFGIWEDNEAGDPSWVAHATKDRGFASWQAWRMSHVNKLGLTDLNWNLYELVDPVDLSIFHAGPFGAWARYYGKQDSLPFRELIKNPHVQANKRLQNMIGNFPAKMNLIGLRRPSGTIVIIEGTHRCLAFSYLSMNKKVPNPQINMALADYPTEKIPLASEIK